MDQHHHTKEDHTQFENLPVELLVLIFKRTDLGTILRVSKQFLNTVQSITSCLKITDPKKEEDIENPNIYQDISFYSNLNTLDFNFKRESQQEKLLPHQTSQIKILFQNLSSNSLRVIKCKNVSPDIFLNMKKKFPMLQKLDLSLCGVGDAGLIELSNIESLTYLKLMACRSITDEGLKHLGKLKNLTYVDFMACNKIKSSGMKFLVELKSLIHLDLSSCVDVKDEGLLHLTELDKLQVIKLSSCGITNIAVGCLSHLEHLTHLDFKDCKNITDPALIYLSNLKNLKILDLYSCRKLTNEGLAHISHLVSIEELNLSICDISDAGMVHISNLTNLKKLDLFGCRNITKNCVTHLSNMANFSDLKIAPNILKT